MSDSGLDAEEIDRRLENVRQAYMDRFGYVEHAELDEPCDLCNVVNADREELVEIGETGGKKLVSLCEDCWQKTLRYNRGEDVDFSPELRMRSEHTDTSTDHPEADR